MISKPGQDQPKAVKKSPVFMLALVILAISLACSFIVPYSTNNKASVPGP